MYQTLSTFPKVDVPEHVLGFQSIVLGEHKRYDRKRRHRFFCNKAWNLMHQKRR